MFKVKATVIDFLGDTEKYPCHHQYKLGDEFIFDGESFEGRICPSLAISVVPRMMEIHSAGPRYKDYVHYYPFLYAPVSKEDPESRVYDGLGFKNVFTTYKEDKYNVANLVSSSSFKWPPPEKRITHRDIRMICPDYRTSVAVKIEAFDISDKGRNIPFYRREMVILGKLLDNPGLSPDTLLNKFSKTQIENIYPALSKVMLEALLEELELMGYVEYKDGKVFATRKSVDKFNTFINSLSKEERLALQV